MKITKSELSRILKEETDRFNKIPDVKYVKLLESDVVHKITNLRENLTKKISSVKDNEKEKVYVLEETLELLEKIYTLL